MKCKVFCKKMLPQGNKCLDAGGEKRSFFSIVHLTPTNDLSSMSTSNYILVMDFAQKKKKKK